MRLERCVFSEDRRGNSTGLTVWRELTHFKDRNISHTHQEIHTHKYTQRHRKTQRHNKGTNKATKLFAIKLSEREAIHQGHIHTFTLSDTTHRH